MKLYRIYTEDKGNAAELLTAYGFEGATIIRAEGIWRGQHEHSVVIELAEETNINVLAFASHIAKINKQASVMVVFPDNSAVLVD